MGNCAKCGTNISSIGRRIEDYDYCSNCASELLELIDGWRKQPRPRQAPAPDAQQQEQGAVGEDENLCPSYLPNHYGPGIGFCQYHRYRCSTAIINDRCPRGFESEPSGRGKESRSGSVTVLK